MNDTKPKAYLVTQGYYSDYHVCGVFSSREKAEAFIKRFEKSTYESPEIEERVIDLFSDVPPDLKMYEVWMKEDGSVIRCELCDTIPLDYDIKVTPNSKDGSQRLYCKLLAKDSAHAVKIANEKRTILIANNWDTRIFS